MEAMKARQPVRLAALRNVKKYIIEAKTAGANIEKLPDADVLKIIRKLAKQGAESAAIYRTQGRADLADEEEAQVAVLRDFLPRELSDDELAAAVREVIAEVGAGAKALLEEYAEIDRTLIELGFPLQFPSKAVAPFDQLSDNLRGTLDTMLDMYEQPENVTAGFW